MRPDPPNTPHDETRLGARDLTRWGTAWGRRLADLAVRVPGPHGRAARWVVQWWVPLAIAAAGALLALMAVAVAAEIYEQVTEERDGLAALDRPALDWSIRHRPEWLTDLMTQVTNAGGAVGIPVLTLAAGALLWWRQRTWTPALTLVVALAVSLAMTFVGKAVIGRARPPLAEAVPPYETSPAFPSGHTLNSTTFAVVAAYLLMLGPVSRRRRLALAAAAVVFAVVIGLTRVYLGHHWLTDVAAGWALGAAWATVVITVHRLVLTVKARRAREPGPVA